MRRYEKFTVIRIVDRPLGSPVYRARLVWRYCCACGDHVLVDDRAAFCGVDGTRYGPDSPRSDT